jgi:hypothetical protein
MPWRNGSPTASQRTSEHQRGASRHRGGGVRVGVLMLNDTVGGEASTPRHGHAIQDTPQWTRGSARIGEGGRDEDDTDGIYRRGYLSQAAVAHPGKAVVLEWWPDLAQEWNPPSDARHSARRIAGRTCPTIANERVAERGHDARCARTLEDGIQEDRSMETRGEARCRVPRRPTGSRRGLDVQHSQERAGIHHAGIKMVRTEF